MVRINFNENLTDFEVVDLLDSTRILATRKDIEKSINYIVDLNLIYKQLEKHKFILKNKSEFLKICKKRPYISKKTATYLFLTEQINNSTVVVPYTEEKRMILILINHKILQFFITKARFSIDFSTLIYAINTKYLCSNSKIINYFNRKKHLNSTTIGYHYHLFLTDIEFNIDTIHQELIKIVEQLYLENLDVEIVDFD